MIYGKCRQNVM